MHVNKAVMESEWNKSYENKDNFLFYPDDEVIRFMSKYIRKRIGLNNFKDINLSLSHLTNGNRVLDLGCGIGRHIMYCDEMGLDSFGIDLSGEAIEFAHAWAKEKKLLKIEERIKQGDVRYLPWDNEFFSYIISHGVLDSMSFEISKLACIEAARVIKPNGFFYCDLISGDDSQHAREFNGEEIIKTDHEKGTLQSYFNLEKIHLMIKGVFDLVECNLIKRKNVLLGVYSSRYHLVLKKM